jgi:hypothetical protein
MPFLAVHSTRKCIGDVILIVYIIYTPIIYEIIGAYICLLYIYVYICFGTPVKHNSQQKLTHFHSIVSTEFIIG